MRSATAKSRLTPSKMLSDLKTLTARQLEKVVEHATLLRLQKQGTVLSDTESKLLKKINHGLAPEQISRLNCLQDRLRQGTLTKKEHRELLLLCDELERQGAARLQALMELAALRETTVGELMDEMGLQEAAYG